MKKAKISKFLLVAIMVATLAVSMFALTACPAHTHEYGEWTVVQNATCTVDGLEERVCSGCTEDTEGHKETRPITASGHNDTVVSNTATYNSEGIITYECSNTGCDRSYTENSNKLGVPAIMQGTWISYDMYGEMDITISADGVQVLGFKIIAWDGNDGTIEIEGYFDYNENDQYDVDEDYALELAVTIARDGSSLQAVIGDGADEMEFEYVKKPEVLGQNGAIVFADVYQGGWYLYEDGINTDVEMIITQNGITIAGEAVTNLAVADVVISGVNMGGYTFTYGEEDVYITRPYDNMLMMVFDYSSSEDMYYFTFIRKSILTEIDEDYHGEWLSDESDMEMALVIDDYTVTMIFMGGNYQISMYELVELANGGYEIYYSSMVLGSILLNQDGTLTFVMYGETEAENMTYVLSKEQDGGDQGGEGGEGNLIDDKFVGTWNGLSNMGIGECVVVVTEDSIIVDGEEATEITAGSTTYGEGYCFTIDGVSYEIMCIAEGSEEAYILINWGTSEMFVLTKGSADSGVVIANEFVGTWVGESELGETYTIIITTEGITVNGEEATNIQPKDDELGGFTFECDSVSYAMDAPMGDGIYLAIGEDDEAFLEKQGGGEFGAIDASFVGTWFAYDGENTYNIEITSSSVTFNGVEATDLQDASTQWWDGITFMVNGVKYGITIYSAEPCLEFYVLDGSDWELNEAEFAYLFEFVGLTSVSFDSNYVGIWEGTSDYDSSIEYTVVITANSITINGSEAVSVNNNGGIYEIICANNIVYKVTQFNIYLNVSNVIAGDDAYLELTGSVPETPSVSIDAQYEGTYTGTDYYDNTITHTVVITTSGVTINGNELTGITVETAAGGAAYIIKGAAANNNYEIMFYMGTAELSVYTSGTMTGYAALTKQTGNEPGGPSVAIDEKYQDYWWHDAPAGDGNFYVLDISADEIILNVGGPGNPMGTDYTATNLTELVDGYSFVANGITYTMVWSEGNWLTLSFSGYTLTLQCTTSYDPAGPATEISFEYRGAWEGESELMVYFTVVITDSTITVNGVEATGIVESNDGMWSGYSFVVGVDDAFIMTAMDGLYLLIGDDEVFLEPMGGAVTPDPTTISETYRGTWEGTGVSVVMTETTISLNGTLADEWEQTPDGGYKFYIGEDSYLTWYNPDSGKLYFMNCLTFVEQNLTKNTEATTPSITINSALVGNWTCTTDKGTLYTIVVTANSITLNGVEATNIVVHEEYSVGYKFEVNGVQYWIYEGRRAGTYLFDVYTLSGEDWENTDFGTMTKN